MVLLFAKRRLITPAVARAAASGVGDKYINYDPVMATFEESEYQTEDDIMMNGRAGGGTGAGGGGSMSNGYVLEGNVVNVDLSALGGDAFAQVDVFENERRRRCGTFVRPINAVRVRSHAT